MSDKIEIRVTRPGLYRRDCCNPEYQEGHYFRGATYEIALGKAWQKFSDDSHLYVGVFKQLVDGKWQRYSTISYSVVSRSGTKSSTYGGVCRSG